MTRGTFKKVGKSRKRLYGQRGLLVCGMTPDEQKALLALLENNAFQGLPVIFAGDGDSRETLKEVFVLENRAGLGKRSGMQRAIIMSGFTQKGLHRLMGIYRVSEMPLTLWATLTAISEKWILSHLLDELTAESEAMKRHKAPVRNYAHKESE